MSRIENALEKAARLRQAPAAPGPARIVAEHRPPLERLLEARPLTPGNPCLDPQKVGPAVGEEFRKLRSRVVHLTTGETFRNVLLVTSTGAGEGKTVSAINLSLALAREYDYTVLLVDTDLRRPTIHNYLGIRQQVGLIQCLRGEVPLERALVKTGLGKLVVLPAGGTVSDPVELLASRRMRNLVRELKERYPERYVIFDSPPALPFADARVLGRAVDGVLFVVREGWARIGQIREALASMEEAPLLGMIYNHAAQAGHNGSYHYY